MVLLVVLEANETSVTVAKNVRPRVKTGTVHPLPRSEPPVVVLLLRVLLFSALSSPLNNRLYSPIPETRISVTHSPGN